MTPDDQTLQIMTQLMRVTCAKDKDDSYCMLQPFMQESLGASSSINPASGVADYLDVCSFCGRKIMGGMTGLMDRADRKWFAKAQAAMCFKKPDDTKYCGDYMGRCICMYCARHALVCNGCVLCVRARGSAYVLAMKSNRASAPNPLRRLLGYYW